MKLLLIISFLIPLVFIWFLISKLGNYLDNNTLKSDDTDSTASSVVLGDTPLAENTARLLDRKGIHAIRLNDPFQLTNEKKLCYLFALSDNDADNIAFSKLGKKLYFIKASIGICNDQNNENMFKSEKMNYIYADGASADKLVQLVLQQPEVYRESKYE